MDEYTLNLKNIEQFSLNETQFRIYMGVQPINEYISILRFIWAFGQMSTPPV
jgi:hypothetical protein